MAQQVLQRRGGGATTAAADGVGLEGPVKEEGRWARLARAAALVAAAAAAAT